MLFRKPSGYFILLFAMALQRDVLFSQTPTNQDCPGAIPVCQNTYNQTNAFAGTGNIPNEINPNPAVSCLGTGERNDVWYTFTVQTAGNLCFTITPNNITDDYDWAVFNLTNANCSDIFTNASLQVGCNYDAAVGPTGPNGLGGAQNGPCIPVNAGETFVVNVSQFSVSPNGYTLDFSASTAVIFDQVPPYMSSIITPVSCASTQLFVNFSENILCSSVQTTDFILTGPNGTYSVSAVTSAACISGAAYDNQYILTVSPGCGPLGNYQLILNDASVQDLCQNNNAGADTIPFNVFPYVVTTSSTPQVCTSVNGTVTANTPFSGVSPFSYIWSTTPPQNTQTATGLIAGTYFVTVTDSVGCVAAASATVTLTGNAPTLSVVSLNDASCYGAIDGNATVTATGGATPYAYLWSNSQAGATANGLSAGTYYVTVTGNNACSDSTSIVINQGNPINISVSSDTTICRGGTAVLFANASGGGGGYTYTWLNGVGSGNPLTVTPAITTMYSVTAADFNGCKSDTASVKVTVHALITVTTSNINPVCQGDSIKLQAAAAGGDGNYQFVWDNGGGLGNPVYVFPVSDTTYTVTVTDGCGTTAAMGTVIVQVDHISHFQFTAFPPSGCIPLNVMFTVQPFVSNNIYTWDFGDSIRQNIQSATINHVYTDDGCQNVSLKVKSIVCDTTVLDSCMIKPLPVPSAEFILTPTNPSTLAPVVTFFDRSSNAETWQWDLGDKATSDLQNLQHEYRDSGTYVVQLVVTDSSGCTDTVEHTLYVDFETTIYIPNTFTPNDDDLNETFAPVMEGVRADGFMMYIFDRWGEIIYQTDNVKNPWDGKMKGQYVRDGVYTYLIKYRSLKGDERKIRGTFTLLK